jgi:hypothetical protein
MDAETAELATWEGRPYLISERPKGGALLMSSTNLWILAVGLVLIVVNVVASSRLAPHIAAFFAHFHFTRREHPGR